MIVAATAGAGLQLSLAFKRDVPETFPYADEHFMYGSIGSEADGVPYWIWAVLPGLFPEHLPDRPGEATPAWGSSTSPGAIPAHRHQPARAPGGPGGPQLRRVPVGTIQDSPDDRVRFVLGMPSHQFDFEGYLRFLFACACDERFHGGHPAAGHPAGQPPAFSLTTSCCTASW